MATVCSSLTRAEARAASASATAKS
jgi:hypothetical protein